MGLIATPYADAEGKLITGGPFQHIAHMFTYAAQQVSPSGPTGDRVLPVAVAAGSQADPRTCASTRRCPGQEFHAIHPVAAFWGMLSPPIMVLGMPALVFCLYRFLRRRRPGQSPRGPAAGDAGDELVHRHLGAVRRAEPGRPAHELHLLHGDRDAGHLRRGHLRGRAGAGGRAGRGCEASSGCGPSGSWWRWCSCIRSWRRSERGRRRRCRRGAARAPGGEDLGGDVLRPTAPVRSITSTPASLRIQVSWRRA